MNLRVAIERSLATAIENPIYGFGLPVTLIAPDGSIQKLNGKIVYDHKVFDPEIGSTMIVHRPVVTLRISSLTRVPVSGESWFVIIPTAPSPDAPTSKFITQDPETDGKSVGFIRLILTATKQAAP